VLEQEVLANRKRLQLEAQDAQKAVWESRTNSSRIIEQLVKEREKINAEVLRLEERKQRHLNTPRLRTPASALTRSNSVLGENGSAGGKSGGKDHYRTVLLVREANKISHHLNQDTVSWNRGFVDSTL
jgi:hypothetical protein